MSHNSFEKTRHGDMSKQPLGRPNVKGSRERVRERNKRYAHARPYKKTEGPVITTNPQK
jgi:hypothetical protein